MEKPGRTARAGDGDEDWRGKRGKRGMRRAEEEGREKKEGGRK